MLTVRRLAPLLLGVAGMACDDSTGPGAVDLHLVARSFETLGRARMGTGDGSGAMASRMASLALRAGLRPARVRIAVDGTTEDYWALEIEHAYGDDVTGGVGDAPILTLPIVTRTMVAWRGGPVERVISITVSSDTGIFSLARLTSEVPPPYPLYIGPAFGIMFERRGPVHFAIDGGARSTRQEIGEACAVPERPSFMQILSPVAAPTSCHRARFFTRFSMQLQDGFGDELGGVRVRTVAMDGHDIPGIRLEYALRWEPCPVCR